MAKSPRNSVGRRGFLKHAAAGAAALAATPQRGKAQPAASSARGAQGPSGAPRARGAGRARPAASALIEHPGSDFMVDVLRALGLEYVASNPGSTFESLHESIINYHQQVMFIEQMSSVPNRGADRVHIGTQPWDPNIAYTLMAKAYGLYAEGPISDPKQLTPALKRAIERVNNGEPALIDLVTQPR